MIDIDVSPVQRARAFAEMVHRGHKYGKDADYREHLVANHEVALWADMTDDDSEIIAFLHDTIEDIDPALRRMAYDFVKANFSTHVFETVWAMTGVGNNRRERNASYYLKIEIYAPAANHKTIDRITNLENAKWKAEDGDDRHWLMYMKEDPEFHSRVVKLVTNSKLRERYERVTGRIA
jgi:(p)ppGpp synthase/HD superfamily hydrolase